mmetsp:Transcript_9275/g.17356  ORF Transcript_9275/g.17356 Transcript_9275/m.17356 type:complete len:227 (-) Transcript_9275:407-1087(-)
MLRTLCLWIVVGLESSRAVAISHVRSLIRSGGFQLRVHPVPRHPLQQLRWPHAAPRRAALKLRHVRANPLAQGQLNVAVVALEHIHHGVPLRRCDALHKRRNRRVANCHRHRSEQVQALVRELVPAYGGQPPLLVAVALQSFVEILTLAGPLHRRAHRLHNHRLGEREKNVAEVEHHWGIRNPELLLDPGSALRLHSHVFVHNLAKRNMAEALELASNPPRACCAF